MISIHEINRCWIFIQTLPIEWKFDNRKNNGSRSRDNALIRYLDSGKLFSKPPAEILFPKPTLRGNADVMGRKYRASRPGTEQRREKRWTSERSQMCTSVMRRSRRIKLMESSYIKKFVCGGYANYGVQTTSAPMNVIRIIRGKDIDP